MRRWWCVVDSIPQAYFVAHFFACARLENCRKSEFWTKNSEFFVPKNMGFHIKIRVFQKSKGRKPEFWTKNSEFFTKKSGVSQKIWVSQKSYVVNRRDKKPKTWVSSDFSLSFTKISVFFCSEFLAKWAKKKAWFIHYYTIWQARCF